VKSLLKVNRGCVNTDDRVARNVRRRLHDGQAGDGRELVVDVDAECELVTLVSGVVQRIVENEWRLVSLIHDDVVAAAVARCYVQAKRPLSITIFVFLLVDRGSSILRFSVFVCMRFCCFARNE